MTAPIWMASPPEVHSALLSSGPGPGQLLAAAAAWSSLSTGYAETAEELAALLAVVQAGIWAGPTAEAYVAAHAPYLAWLTQASANSAAMAFQQETVAAAYTTALAAMPTLPQLAANHAAHAVLVATSFFGSNMIPIVLNEADYARMWIQAATVMSMYQGVVTTASTAVPQTAPAPKIMKVNALVAASDESLPLLPGRQNQIQQWLQQIGYTDFYNNVIQSLINSLKDTPFFQEMFSGFDPWLPELGNPLVFLNPFNIAFALGYPMDIGSYVAYLSQTFAFIGADLAAAFASGNPATIGFTLLFTTVEAIGTIITDTIALLRTLLEQTFVLLPAVLPLLTVSLAPLVVTPVGVASSFAGLTELAGLVGVTPPALPVTPPVVALAPVISASTPALAPAPVPAAATALASTPGPPPPPATAPPPVTGAGMESFAYLVGGLNSVARKAAGTSAREKASELDSTEAPAVAVMFQEQVRSQRYRRAKAKQLGRGYEYMDLEPDIGQGPNGSSDEQRVASAASDRGAGTLGFAGTARKQTTTAAAGLATLADDAFGGGPRMPMMPGTRGVASAPFSEPGDGGDDS